MSPTDAVEAAINHLGSQARVAAAVNVKQPTVSEWKRGDGKVPKERAAEIEVATTGKVTCEQLRPDLAWSRVPDTSYAHHPAGRPVIEVLSITEAA